MINEVFTQDIKSNNLSNNNYLLPQSAFSSGPHSYQYEKVSYISDIHLEKHLNCNFPIKPQIKSIVKKLYNSKQDSKLIIFGGDLAQDKNLCTLFYHQFMLLARYNSYKNWKESNHYSIGLSLIESTDLIEKKIDSYTKSIKKEVLSLKKWFRYDKRHSEMHLDQIENLVQKKPIPHFIIYRIRKIKSLEKSLHELLINKTKHIEALQKQTSFTIQSNLQVFVVLGNHELHDFNTISDAVHFYQPFFKKERIHFLHNNWLSTRSRFGIKSFCILGGVGFARYNEKYNADTLIGPLSFNREKELLESQEFLDNYNIALKYAAKNQIPLLVISHYPTKDWLPENSYDSHCIYFTGHTHRDNSVHSDNVTVYANNQIGYNKNTITFKKATLGLTYNPFIDLEDGYHEITTSQYIQFYLYSGESLQGTYPIDKQLEKDVAKFYVIKKNGFYGFFIMNKRSGSKICVGGKIKNINKIHDINYFYETFTTVIEHFMTLLTPYRKVQEQFSSEIKSLGFSGKIHGTIIDIDWFNHIMINPFDGKVTFYYSPVFGKLMPFNSFKEQLLFMQKNNNSISQNNNNLLNQYEQMKNESENCLIIKSENELSNEINKLVDVDIKNSLYGVSSKLNQLQRLFDSNILREWNDDFASKIISDKSKYLPQKKKFTYLGKRKIMNCGYWCTVIKIHNEDDFTIQFDDGVILEHVSRSKFVGKRIKHPSLQEIDKRKSFGELYPDLLVDWDYKNNTIDPFKTTPGCADEASWVCVKCKTQWNAKIQKRSTGRSICPNCHRRIIDRDSRLRKN